MSDITNSFKVYLILADRQRIDQDRWQLTYKDEVRTCLSQFVEFYTDSWEPILSLRLSELVHLEVKWQDKSLKVI